MRLRAVPTQISIASPLAPDEARRRIEASFDSRLGPALVGFRRKMLGRIEGENIRVTLFGWRRQDNGFGVVMHTNAPVFVGRVDTTATGSRLSGTIDDRDYIKWFIPVWFGGLFLMALFGLVSMGSDLVSRPGLTIANMLLGIAILLAVLGVIFGGMFLIGTAIFRMLTRFRDVDAAEMLGRLAVAIDGDPAAVAAQIRPGEVKSSLGGLVDPSRR